MSGKAPALPSDNNPRKHRLGGGSAPPQSSGEKRDTPSSTQKRGINCVTPEGPPKISREASLEALEQRVQNSLMEELELRAPTSDVLEKLALRLEVLEQRVSSVEAQQNEYIVQLQRYILELQLPQLREGSGLIPGMDGPAADNPWELTENL
ncbi:hypothetical protein AJ80_10019 [Polytolypa hystricis UAMH7299]|uniref:Uncharacterized protein n=1 Tax=Polytolypa hystricis (strain UAMH7299) TaxID=1447883 RepID=A0A2B7WEP3_POLH7|nr:hypothetical protein AJ80_10019 [Polytolypa hystricis UAMH7299]